MNSEKRNWDRDSRSEPCSFQTTHWSVVLAAGAEETQIRMEPLSELCRNYWYPLYAYVRRRGYSHHDAQDLIQAFFVRLLTKESIKTADPNRGRFRTFILASLKNFLADEWDKRRAIKRGGDLHFIDIDSSNFQERYEAAASESLSPEKLFDRSWMRSLLDRATQQVQREYDEAGKAGLFAALEPYVSNSGEAPAKYSEIAERLGMGLSAVKMTVARMRKQFRQHLRTEVAQTLADPENVEDEIRSMLSAL